MSSPHTPPSAPSAACLQPSTAIDSDHPAVVAFAREHATGQTDRERAVSLYLAVRDRLRYDPYRIDLSPAGMRASTALSQGFGWCVPKAVALAAVARAAGIPARLGFTDVRNHLSTERLRQTMKTDVEQTAKDTHVLIEMMQRISGHKPKKWNAGTLGFDTYHYKYDSGREGDGHVIDFYPRKGKITVYLMDGTARYSELLAKLGKHTTTGYMWLYQAA